MPLLDSTNDSLCSSAEWIRTYDFEAAKHAVWCLRCASCSESLELLRQLVDIKAASSRNRHEAEEIGLVDENIDSRTRSTCSVPCYSALPRSFLRLNTHLCSRLDPRDMHCVLPFLFASAHLIAQT
eukprot:COSAG02_NODE_6590_length_3473_cov_2.408000_4_plen_126_part_00